MQARLGQNSRIERTGQAIDGLLQEALAFRRWFGRSVGGWLGKRRSENRYMAALRTPDTTANHLRKQKTPYETDAAGITATAAVATPTINRQNQYH